MRGLSSVVALFLGIAVAGAQVQDDIPTDTERPVDTTFGALPMAGGAVSPYQEYADKIRAAEMVTPLTSELFGENVSLYNRQTEFSSVDIDISGNNALPVQLRRRLVVAPIDRSAMAQPFGGFGNWDIDVPYISGVFDGTVGWGGRGSIPSQDRCSTFFKPSPLATIGVDEIWSGNSVHIPGRGDRELIRLNAPRYPGDGNTHLWGTSGFDTFYCKPSTANGYKGEGFVMLSPDGLKYTFDWGAERSVPPVQRGSLVNDRLRVYLLATKVEDRYGNHVKFTYDGYGNLQTVQGFDRTGAADGRKIKLDWTSGRIGSATENPNPAAGQLSRTWNYGYQTHSGDTQPRLTSVTLPDASTWAFEYPGDYLYVDYERWDGSNSSACSGAPRPLGEFKLNITHPSGATGKFEFAMGRHGRSGVPQSYCIRVFSFGGSGSLPDQQPSFRMAVSPFSDVYSLQSKTITGAGLPPDGLKWTYAQTRPLPGHFPGLWAGSVVPCTTCEKDKIITVRNPDGSATHHRFGIVFGHNEGKLLQTDQLAIDSSVLQSEETEYICGNNSDDLPCQLRYGTQGGGDDPSAGQIWAVKEKRITQQNVPFKRTNETFDAFARPLKAKLSGTPGAERTETTVYRDIQHKWVLGLVASVTHEETNKVMVKNDHDAQGNLERVAEFGNVISQMTWHTDGTLNTVTDGLKTAGPGSAHTTTLGTFKRGIPQSVSYDDGTSKSVVIDDLGRISSVTDEVLSTTSYDYDLLGRLKTITHPPRESGAWKPTTVDFKSTLDSELDLVGKHWRQTTTTDKATKTIYFDALWRPVVTSEYDSAHRAETQRYVRREYDHANRGTFISYPSTNSSASMGARTEYDVLGRPTSVTQDSEFGPLVTLTAYQSGFKKQVTDPRNRITTTTFKAFDTPNEGAPLTITAPEGVTVSITRDAYNKPTAVMRSGQYAGGLVSATRRYVYDDYQRLCKTIEPESGATVHAYDFAGNVSWSAKGSSLTGPTCDRDSVPANQRTAYGYDERNRLLRTTYPGTTYPVIQTWYPDGALKSLSTNDAIWTYQYNTRRLLEQESLAYDGKTFRIDWTHNANGHVNGMIYPDAMAIDFAPNALGQPTKAGAYARIDKYFPNGAISDFTYGNGIVHSLIQNERQLPLHSKDGAVTHLTYGYDRNANLVDIVDNLNGAADSRSMDYDGLNRLTDAFAPQQLWATAEFTYDPLDNLRESKVGARKCKHEIDANNRLERLSGPNCPPTAYGYDTLGRGNVTSRANQTFTFDLADRITSTAGDAGAETYVYDGHGRRVRITRDNAKTYQVYSHDGQLLHELAPDGNATNYVYLNGSLLARTGGSGAAPSATPNPSFDGLYTVSWAAVPGATSYQLLQTVDGGSESPVYTGALRTWSPPTAKPSGLYAYRVAACNPTCSAPGGRMTVTVLRSLDAPSADPNPSHTGSYKVEWIGPAAASGYRLDERQGAGSWSNGDYGATASKEFSGKANGSWRYRVSVCASASQCGTASAELLVTVQPAVDPPPPVPGGLTLTPAASVDGQYTATWNAAIRATGYDLQERFESGAWQLVASNQPSRSWWPNPPKTQSGTYSYQVRARNSGGESAWSPSQSVVVNAVPMPAWIRVSRAYVRPGVNYTVSWAQSSAQSTYTLEESPYGCSGSVQVWSGLSVLSKAFVAVLPTSCDRIEYRYRVRACEGSACSPWTEQAIVEVTSDRPTLTAALGTVYYHTDALRSPMVQTDASGNPIAGSRTYYEPYGAPTTGYVQGPGYTGHVTDAKTRLSYMQQRYYDPIAGRFLSTDPVVANMTDGGNFNRYWYAANNPYKYIDPDGRFQSSPWQLATVPGQRYFDNAMTSWENGNYGHAALYGAAMLGEQALTVATLGQGRAAGTLSPAIVPVAQVGRSGTKNFIDGLASSAVDANKRRGGNINYSLAGGRKAWEAASSRISEGLEITYNNKGITKGMTRDGASVEIRSFSSGGGKDSLTIKISQTGSNIKHMFRWEKK